ncbi:MAG: DNA-deoxyinosine glycosylase [Eubacteriaceae bacterium]|nr:DNA-deoxyinosine glycosylase [Eubacteriaceae bacterium]
MALITHPYKPIYDERSKLLLIGSFPSKASRSGGFYYANPRNRFWRVLGNVFSDNSATGAMSEKIAFLLRHEIALWDVAAQCDSIGSLDSQIKVAKTNDFSAIFASAKIAAVLANGTLAYTEYKKHCMHLYNVPLERIPSSSPANAAYSLERLASEWAGAIGRYIKIPDSQP